MALTLAYSVTGLKVKDEVNSEGVTHSNAVCQTYWKVTGTDDNGNVAEWSGATPFTAASVPAADFTSFENLEEATVVGWITAVVEADATYKQHIIGQLQRNLDEQVTTEPTMPWATDEVAAAADAAADGEEAPAE